MGGNKENNRSNNPEVNMHDLKDYLGAVGIIVVASVSVYEQSIEPAIGVVAVATAINTFMEWRTMRIEKKFIDNHKL